MAIEKVFFVMTLGFITVLLAYQLMGEVISKGLELPLPGPVVGMGLLFVTLLIRGGLPEGLKKTSQGLLSHLSLLFVPAGVGVMMHMHLLANEWQAISVALVVSTGLTVLLTAGVMIGLMRLTGDKPSGEEIKRD